MRPVNKSHPGDTVCYMDSQGMVINHIIQPYYDPYGNAKMPICGNIGNYCSYCECHERESSLAIEHIVPKSQGGDEKAWNNFLLSCTICNSTKGITVISSSQCHFPHLNNTFLSFIYDQTGRIRVNPNIPLQSQEKANNLLKLTHLDRFPSTSEIPSPKDFRWQERYECWNTATKLKEYYLLKKISEDDIIKAAKREGNWSIWFTVFSGMDAILSRLISDFPGTSSECFDAGNHYAPVERNPGQTDPV